MNMSTLEIWGIIVALGVGSFLLRFSFLGLIGDRNIPEWLLRYLRYTPVAILPGLVAPLVIWPEATGHSPDPARISAAAITLIVGYFTKNVILSILSGIGTLYAGLYFFG